MAVDTFRPNVVVFSAVDGEIHIVVIEGSRHPARVGGMALNTVGREVRRLVVWISGCGIIVRMAGKTVGGCIVEISILMAGVTILYIMSQGQGEEIVIDSGRHPPGICCMTLHTVGWKIPALVIGILSHGVIVHMAGKTVGRNITEI